MAPAPAPEVDWARLRAYGGSLGLQWVLMCGTLGVLDFLGGALGASELLGAREQVAVGLFFTALALRSRLFARLPAPRPRKDSYGTLEEVVRPSWTPPRLVFPIVWSTIAVLRGTSSAMVWAASGERLFCWPLAVFCLHLCVGDVWNFVNNVENDRGVAVPGVFLCLLSASATVAAYWQVLPRAGLVLLPLPLWLCVASTLVTSIYFLNGRGPLYPAKDA